MTCLELAEILSQTPTLPVFALGRNVIGLERSPRVHHSRDMDLVMARDEDDPAAHPPVRVFACEDIAKGLRLTPDRGIKLFTQMKWHDVSGVDVADGIASISWLS